MVLQANGKTASLDREEAGKPFSKRKQCKDDPCIWIKKTFVEEK
jgi:hypothetical protein